QQRHRQHRRHFISWARTSCCILRSASPAMVCGHPTIRLRSPASLPIPRSFALMITLRRKLALTAALIFALSAAPLLANGIKTAKPEEVGLSSERLARIGERMQAYVDSGEIPGAVALIARHGKIAYFEHWGVADREKKVAMKPD